MKPPLRLPPLPKPNLRDNLLDGVDPNLAQQNRWRRDPLLFRHEAIHLTDKSNRPTRYIDTPARQQVRDRIGIPGRHAVLKARQMGISVEVLLALLHRVLYRKAPTRAALCAHTDSVAVATLRRFVDLYDRLNPAAKALNPIEQQSQHSITFHNGAVVEARTAYSESWRSNTYDFLHLSEAAFWTDYQQTTRALEQTASPDAVVIYETTPNGPNEFYQSWRSPHVAWDRIFLPWWLHTEYRSEAPIPSDLSPAESALLSRLPPDLDKAQLSWAIHTIRTKCQSSVETFLQEYPIDPESCFLLSGKRYFDRVFPQPDQSTPPELVIYQKPQPLHRYSIGVDGASGSPTGDYSTCVILDTTQTPYSVAARLRTRQPPSVFATQLANLVRPYQPNCLLVERNADGVSIGEHLQRHGIRIKTDPHNRPFWVTTQQSRPKLLADLYEAIARNRLVVSDPAICGELNSFGYNQDGRPEAAQGAQDDLVFALGLAVQAIPHTPNPTPENTSLNPHNPDHLVRLDIHQLRSPQTTPRRLPNMPRKRLAGV